MNFMMNGANRKIPSAGSCLHNRKEQKNNMVYCKNSLYKSKKLRFIERYSLVEWGEENEKRCIISDNRNCYELILERCAIEVKKEYDVVIVGAGPAGVGVGSALKQMGLTNFVILERNSVGS